MKSTKWIHNGYIPTLHSIYRKRQRTLRSEQMKKYIAVFLSAAMLFSGCSGFLSSSAQSTNQDENMGASSEHMSDLLIGGAILKEPVRKATKDVYMDTGIYKTDEYGKFTKAMTVYGITFVSSDEVSDAFMRKVAVTLKEMFPQVEGEAKVLQESVLQNMYMYNAMLPIVKDEASMEKFMTEDIQTKASICDIIMKTDEGQVMEVVEHLLHAITDVGLHYSMNDQFGISNTSAVKSLMDKDIASKAYNAESYNEFTGELKTRILIQEYAYWLISSYWNLQDPYGTDKQEWAYLNKVSLEKGNPDAVKLLDETVASFMAAPTKATLEFLTKDAPIPEQKSAKKVAPVTKASNQTPAQVEISNPSYVKYVDTSDIKTDLSTLGDVYKKNYAKYIQYIAPNGKPITIVAQDKVSDEQVLRAYNLLSFYLTDFGQYDKTQIANKMADSQAILNMPNGADGHSQIADDALTGQPLYQLEVPVEGHKWYTENNYEHRDAAFEEILHMVHDYGIGTQVNPGAAPELQKQILAATNNALPKNKADWGKKGLWGLGSRDWLLELSKEGSLEQEYLAAVVDSHYGLWGPFKENSRGMWGLYTSKLRSDIQKNDPMGYAIVTAFLPEYVDAMMRIDPSFKGTLQMTFNENTPYTHKTQYLKDVRLTGSNNSNVSGNNYDNIFMGNSGHNAFDGKEGTDIIQFSGVSTDYAITVNGQTITVKSINVNDGNDILINVEVLRFADKDILAATLH